MQITLMGPAVASPPSACSSQAGLLYNRERPLSGPLLGPGGSRRGEPGSGPGRRVMPEPWAPGDVAAAIGPRGIFAFAGATVTEECTAALTVAEGRNAAHTALEGDNEASVGHFHYRNHIQLQTLVIPAQPSLSLSLFLYLPGAMLFFKHPSLYASNTMLVFNSPRIFFFCPQ